MTPLMMLALTLPPSIAFVIERWMRGREAQARKLNERDSECLRLTGEVQDEQARKLEAHDAELKRLNDQLSLIADRYR